jgi:hypothetical protein
MTRVRINNASGSVVSIYGTAHGDVREMMDSILVYQSAQDSTVTCTTPSSATGCTHPVLYASKDGHSVWNTPGDNEIMLGRSVSHQGMQYGPVKGLDLGVGPLSFSVHVYGKNYTDKGARFDSSSHYQLMSVYSTYAQTTSGAFVYQGGPGTTTINDNDSSGTANPLNASRNVVSRVECRYGDGTLMIRPYTDVDTSKNAVLSAEDARAVCPRAFTLQSDGITAAANTDWWFLPYYGQDVKDHEIPSDSELMDLLKYPVLDLAALACMAYCGGPEDLICIGICVGAVEGAAYGAVDGFKGKVIPMVMPLPGAPASPFWHDCGLYSEGSC